MANTTARNCQQCGAPVEGKSIVCKFCGAETATVQDQNQSQQYAQPQYAQPQYAQPQYVQPQVVYVPVGNPSTKSKTTAGVLAILLGGIGIHKFYLGKIGIGIVYILFCWTYVPVIIGLIEGIIYLTSSDEKFYLKYVKK